MTENERIIGEKYKIIKKIGSGSFGRVYKAENILNKEEVAIKEITKSLLEGSDYLYEAFGKELEIMKLCESKNSVKLIEHLEDEENHYLFVGYFRTDISLWPAEFREYGREGLCGVSGQPQCRDSGC